MDTFPHLKTSAVMQYPATRVLSYSTRVIAFTDGTEQRFRTWKTSLRRWIIRLDLLDESELSLIEQFFRSQQGQYSSFAFTDPWDCRVYLNCSIEQEELTVELTGEGRGRTAVVIVENRVGLPTDD